MSENIKINIDSDGIAILEIDVKDRPMNVITADFGKELAECVEKVSNDENIIGAIITSLKNDFMAGADL